MSGFQPFAMWATYFSLYASIQIKIIDSFLVSCRALTYSQEKNIKNSLQFTVYSLSGIETDTWRFLRPKGRGFSLNISNQGFRSF